MPNMLFLYKRGMKWCGKCQEVKDGNNLRCPDCNQLLRSKRRR